MSHYRVSDKCPFVKIPSFTKLLRCCFPYLVEEGSYCISLGEYIVRHIYMSTRTCIRTYTHARLLTHTPYLVVEMVKQVNPGFLHDICLEPNSVCVCVYRGGKAIVFNASDGTRDLMHARHALCLWAKSPDTSLYHLILWCTLLSTSLVCSAHSPLCHL